MIVAVVTVPAIIVAVVVIVVVIAVVAVATAIVVAVVVAGIVVIIRPLRHRRLRPLSSRRHLYHHDNVRLIAHL